MDGKNDRGRAELLPMGWGVGIGGFNLDMRGQQKGKK